jgi:predicted Zn finger-like uncharacterized protein
VKFVCDKCKTRYSIGEDRVRGKILKIRCKNCANVITVREGMDADGENRTGRSTMAVPLVGANVSGPVAAPSSLHEEWYVSIDGVQTGPLTLLDAQRWITSKPLDAELHCWNEGFDDWLPVDKVSHFRNLRQRPRERAKTTPPPLPEKPLFAATMAAIEKEASGPSRTPSVPAIPSVARMAASGPNAARPQVPVAARPQIPTATKPSSPALPTPGSQPLRTPSSPALAKQSSPSLPKAKSPTPARGSATGSPRVVPSPAASASSKLLATGGAASSATAAALADAFQADDAHDALTAVNAQPFEDEPRSEPAAARPRNMFDLGPASSPEVAVPSASPPVEPRSVKQMLDDDDDEDDGFAIGEVSRVVNLADLAPRAKPKAAGTGSTAAVARVGTATAGVARISSTALGGLTGTQPRLSPAELGMNVDPSLVSTTAGGMPSANESIVAASFAQKHRRGLVALIAFSALLVAGVIGVVAWVVSKNSDVIGGGFGGMKQIDTSRPEDIVRRQLEKPPEAGSGSAHVTQKTPTKVPVRNSTTTSNPIVEEPSLNALQASEIEDMANKQGEGTKRCYMRAQKGAMGFEIAEIKKISVTLMVAKDGTVTSVQLSSHGNDSFGQCLIARIKAWKFRASSGGTYRISLAFST